MKNKTNIIGMMLMLLVLSGGAHALTAAELLAGYTPTSFTMPTYTPTVVTLPSYTPPVVTLPSYTPTTSPLSGYTTTSFTMPTYTTTSFTLPTPTSTTSPLNRYTTTSTFTLPTVTTTRVTTTTTQATTTTTQPQTTCTGGGCEWYGTCTNNGFTYVESQMYTHTCSNGEWIVTPIGGATTSSSSTTSTSPAVTTTTRDYDYLYEYYLNNRKCFCICTCDCECTCPETTTTTQPVTTTTNYYTTTTCYYTTTTQPHVTTTTRTTTTSTTTTTQPTGCGYLKLFKFNDHDGDGVWEEGEEKLGGFHFTMTGPVALQFYTDSYGESFANCIPYGTYTITEAVPEGWQVTTGNPRTITINSPAQKEVKFGNRQVAVTTTSTTSTTTTTLCGNLKIVKYNDYDEDGVRDSNEPGIGGIPFTVSGPVSKSGYTDENGRIYYECIKAGDYTITETMINDWVATTPNPRQATVKSGETTTVRFGNIQKPVTTTTSTTSTTTTTQGSCARGVTVRASGEEAAGVLPEMRLYIDGSLKAVWDVLEVTRDYTYDIDLCSGEHTVDVVYTNDCYANAGTDRNLYVYYLKIGNNKIYPDDPSVEYDRGSGSQAFDGLDVIDGTGDMQWNGALRFQVENGAGPSAAPQCQYYYWFDDEHDSCQYSQFCGSFMYYGLRTFQTQASCQAALPSGGAITLADVVDMITLWAQGDADMQDVIALITAYKNQ